MRKTYFLYVKYICKTPSAPKSVRSSSLLKKTFISFSSLSQIRLEVFPVWAMDGGAEGSQQPHLVLAHKLFLLTHPDVQDIEKVRLKAEVLDSIKSDG